MNSYCKTFIMVVAVTLTLMLCLPAVAQGPADLTVADPATRPHPRQRLQPRMLPAPVPQYPTGGGAGDDWRVAISIYGWFPGVRGHRWSARP